MKKWIIPSILIGALVIFALGAGEISGYFFTSYTATATGTGARDDTNWDIPADLGGMDWLEVQLTCDTPTSSTGSSTPKMDVDVQTSLDGTNYDHLTSFTQMTTTAVRTRNTVLRTTSANMGKKVRVKFQVGTTSGTATYSPTIHWMSGSN